MAQHGGKRAGAGRKPGGITQAKKDIAKEAGKFAEKALAALVDVAQKGTSEAARVSASIAILDRAYGKPFAMSGDEDGDAAPALNINITTAAPVKDVRVTRSDT